MPDDEKIGPKEFSDALSDAVFELLQQDVAAMEFYRLQASKIPWANLTRAELSYDQYTTEEMVKVWYARLQLKPPRFAWAPSPAAMFTAINMLRTVQMGQRHNFINAIVPAEDPQAAARRTLLEAIIDRNVTVTMGGAVKNLLNWRDVGESIAVRDAIRFLDHYRLRPMNAAPVSPVFEKHLPVNESTIYPANHHECIGSLQLTVFCFSPYVHVCWFCHPPVETRIYDDGHLELMRWSDGYEIALPPVPKDDEELEAAPEPLRLGDGTPEPVADELTKDEIRNWKK